MFSKFLLLPIVIGLMTPRLCAARSEARDSRPDLVDFSRAVIVTSSKFGSLEQKAVTVLREEIQKRAGIDLKVVTQWPESKQPRRLL